MLSITALLVSCGPAVTPFDGSSGPDAQADTAAPLEAESPPETGTSPETGAPDEEEPPEQVEGVPPDDSWHGACADFYDPDLLPTFELDFSEDAWAGIASDCSRGAQNYWPVTFTYEGEVVEAMARLKGNWSWSCDKYQFVISFNEEDSGARFHGVRKIMLDAPWYDHTLLHERLAFPLFQSRGLPYSCANNAKLMINGEYYGLYANLERIDHEYLERIFTNPDGNLYQGGTELKTNEDINDTSDLDALNAARSIKELESMMDLDQAVAEWSMEAMIPALDNYWAGVEINYYLYNHPDRGFVYIPYDLDISFGDSAYSDGSLIWPDSVTADPITYEHTGWQKELLVEAVLADPTWCARFVEELVLSRAAYVPEALVAQVEEWDAQILEALIADPNKTFSDARHTAAVAQLKEYFQRRADFVDAWLAEGGHCPTEP